ncbi:MAG: D-xylose-binding periplasmic protein precursor [Spirochaetes bacterium ADurb.Bin269]|jgi:D-xylose transport system substrate-binding protein|nr:MAG: D-xylose-binding periplasmic protein precursor [Spirochaetes bacterium ADurb.Bin269]
MNRPNLAALLAVAVLCAPFCSSCRDTRKTGSGSPSASQITIGFSLDSLIVERWIRDRDVFVSAASKLGADVIFQNAANDQNEQVNQVKYLIDKGVDVLVIIPQNAELLSDSVQKAKAKGIKVISYDRLIRNAPVDLYVSVNSVDVGRIMAEAIIREAPSGNYVFINGPKSDYNVSLVKQGQDSVFVKYPGVYHVLDFYADNWSYDQAYEQVSALLDKGTIIDAIVCGNDGLAGGAIRALSERRLAGTIPVVGQDADISACQYVVEGSQLITIYKPISLLARQAAEFAVAMAKNEFVPPETIIDNGTCFVPVHWLEPVGVSKDNMKDVIIDSGFHTAEEVYRNIPAGRRGL